MRKTAIAAILALFALGSSAFVAFARDGDIGVLVGRIVDVTLNGRHDDRLDTLVLRVTDKNEPVDDNNDDPSFYRIDVNGDTSVDLNGVNRHDLVGEHAVVEGNNLNVDNRTLTADQLVVLGRNGGNDNGNGNRNGNDNEDNGPGMSAAAHFKNDHIPPGPGRGAFMRCVHDAEANGAAADENTFRRCANQVNGDNFNFWDNDNGNGGGNGNGNGWGHDKHDKD